MNHGGLAPSEVYSPEKIDRLRRDAEEVARVGADLAEAAEDLASALGAGVDPGPCVTGGGGAADPYSPSADRDSASRRRRDAKGSTR